MSDPRPNESHTSDYPYISEVLGALDFYECVLNGRSVVCGNGAVILLDEVIEWHKQCRKTSNRFWHWCQSNALLISEMGSVKAYYGETARLLDFDTQEVNWQRYFEANMRSRVSGKPSLAQALEDIIVFETTYGFATIGNPYLFPSRNYIAKTFGGFTANSPSDEERPRGRHARKIPSHAMNKRSTDFVVLTTKLQDAYEKDRSSTMHITKMVEAAARAYVKNSYDAVAIYEDYRDVIGAWAERTYFAQHAGLYSEESKKLAVNRLAMIKMVKAENLILAEINSMINTTKAAPQKLDREKMRHLRKGSVYRP